MESSERIAGSEEGEKAGAAANLFAPDVDDDSGSEVDILTKNVMVSPTEDQFTLLHSRLRERLLQGETIYEIGVGGESFCGRPTCAPEWYNDLYKNYLHLSDIITVRENCLKPKCNQRMFRYVSLNSMFGSFQEEATRTSLNLYC